MHALQPSPTLIFHGDELPHAYDQPESFLESSTRHLTALPNRLRRMFPQLDALKPHFGWASNEKIKTMLDKTTQHCRGVVHYPF